ncbi:MAG: hypothetical protein FRX49_10226 [Trebouxia sp. A1-2]|nr:MAG: hypothetical protein FRX49_10226 [Trebouxia sp. A1-2]
MPQLPDLVLQNIFEQSDFQDLARIACVSKHFHEIAATAHGNSLSFANKESGTWTGLGDSKTCIRWMQKNLSRLDRVSSIIHCPRAFGTEISSLLGLLPSLASAFLWDSTTWLNFDYKLLPSCSCMTSLVKLTCYGDDESLIVTGPVTVFPILEECIFQLYQETATSEVLEWFENWDMAAYRAQKAVKPAAEGVEAQKT